MTLQEAIECGILAVGDNANLYRLADKEALKILIEAGKRIKEGRTLGVVAMMGTLPGETLG